MRTLCTKLLMAACLIGLFTTSDAHALDNSDYCMAFAATTITVDSGTSKTCNGTTGTYCADQSCGGGWTTVPKGTACPSGKTGAGPTITRRCCVGVPCYANMAEDVDAEEATTLEESEPTENSFSLDMTQNEGIYAGVYWGYVNDGNRSPAAGRGTMPLASLDACLFHTDVDAIPGNSNVDKWYNCTKAAGVCEESAKNEHCRNSGLNDGATVSSAVCKDRCDCVFGFGTCENK